MQTLCSLPPSKNEKFETKPCDSRIKQNVLSRLFKYGPVRNSLSTRGNKIEAGEDFHFSSLAT